MLVLSVNLKGVLAPRYKNVDFPSFPPWAAKNLAVMPGDPGYHTVRSVGLRHWVPTDVTGRCCLLLVTGCPWTRLLQGSCCCWEWAPLEPSRGTNPRTMGAPVASCGLWSA